MPGPLACVAPLAGPGRVKNDGGRTRQKVGARTGKKLTRLTFGRTTMAISASRLTAALSLTLALVGAGFSAADAAGPAGQAVSIGAVATIEWASARASVTVLRAGARIPGMIGMDLFPADDVILNNPAGESVTIRLAGNLTKTLSGNGEYELIIPGKGGPESVIEQLDRILKDIRSLIPRGRPPEPSQTISERYPLEQQPQMQERRRMEEERRTQAVGTYEGEKHILPAPVYPPAPAPTSPPASATAAAPPTSTASAPTSSTGSVRAPAVASAPEPSASSVPAPAVGSVGPPASSIIPGSIAVPAVGANAGLVTSRGVVPMRAYGTAKGEYPARFVAEGRNSLTIAWSGGVAPFTIKLAGPSGSPVVILEANAPQHRLSFNVSELRELSTYEIWIEDSSRPVEQIIKFSFLVVAKDALPEPPWKSIPVDTSPTEEQAAYAIWLGTCGGPGWQLEALSRLAELSAVNLLAGDTLYGLETGIPLQVAEKACVTAATRAARPTSRPKTP